MPTIPNIPNINGFLSNFKKSSGFSYENAEAEAYITAIEAEGVTTTDDQKSTLDAFWTTKKAASGTWGGKQLRFWMPVHGVVAANAIDVIDQNVLTFVGTSIHSIGYVTSDGVSGYATTLSQGLNTGSMTLGFIKTNEKVTVNTFFADVQGGGRMRRYASGDTFALEVIGANHVIWSDQNAVGIILAGFNSGGTQNKIYQRSSSGFATRGTGNSGQSGSAGKFYFMSDQFGRLDVSGTRFGGFITSDGMNDSEAEAMTLALKNLYEGWTGLTIP